MKSRTQLGELATITLLSPISVQHLDVGDVLWEDSTLGTRGTEVVVGIRRRVCQFDTLPATLRRRFAAWVWRRWGRN